MDTNFIFITGGVISSLGKGVATASIAALLENVGLDFTMIKMDPYINVDPGTMSPIQHGEVFVTEDGAETDLDLGHYERFTELTMSRINNFTTGGVYNAVIEKERRGLFLGKTVQVIPHVTDQIKENLHDASKGKAFALVEVGGTVGDIESLPFLETLRQMRHELGSKRTFFVHLTLIPWIETADELKTKPTQHSVHKLREIGVQPNMLLCRCERELPEPIRRKISMFTDVAIEAVITARDAPCLYEIPLLYHEQQLDRILMSHFDCKRQIRRPAKWDVIRGQWRESGAPVKIGMVGKYVHLKDSYKSLYESLLHASLNNGCSLEIDYASSDAEDLPELREKLEGFDGVIIPGGFGNRGVEGKIAAVRYLRETGKPYFGICLGLQIAVIEFARNVAGIRDADSEELKDDAENPVIGLMEEQKSVKNKGGTMRLGNYEAELKPGSLMEKIYGKNRIEERHRHRYEINNDFTATLEKHGMVFSARNPRLNLVEALEIPEHPFFVGVQFHPEFKSKPGNPHPVFNAFVKACLDNRPPRIGTDAGERTDEPAIA